MTHAPCVLITRPETESIITAQQFEAAGLQTSRFPVLTIRQNKGAIENIHQTTTGNTQAIALTSRHGLDALIPFPETRKIPLFVAGSASAELAKGIGFEIIHTGNGHAESLVKNITAHCSPEAGSILYLRGETISEDITQTLKKLGYNAQEIITYAATPADHIPNAIIQKIRAGEIHACTAYSRHSLKCLQQLMEKHELTKALNRIHLVCFSAKIAEIATNGLWQKVIVAETPEAPAMLNAFKRLYGDPPRITTET